MEEVGSKCSHSEDSLRWSCRCSAGSKDGDANRRRGEEGEEGALSNPLDGRLDSLSVNPKGDRFSLSLSLSFFLSSLSQLISPSV